MYRRILVVLETDPAGCAAVEQALALAADGAAEVVFVAVVPEFAMSLADVSMAGIDTSEAELQAADRQAQQELDAAVRLAEAAGIRCRAVKVVSQDRAESIVATARRLSCDVIVVESLGRNSIMRLLDGSVIPPLITLSPLPVLVVRHGTAASNAALGAASPRRDTSSPHHPDERSTT